MTRSGLAALVAACATLAQPASSLAATVGVEELPTEPRQARVAFESASGEANRLTVSIAGEEGHFYDLRLLDTAAPIQPGLGCSGGGGPGVAVRCKVHKPTPGDDFQCFKGCIYTPGTKWDLRLIFKLGNAGSRLDTTGLPAGAVDPQQPAVAAGAAPIWVSVTPGAGDDTVLTGPGPDVIESSPGADLARTGKGDDEFNGGPLPDGPDTVHLGHGIDSIDYSERSDGIRYDPDGLADDGGDGEGDNLGVAVTVQGGAGADTLTGAPDHRYGSFLGGAGDDAIHGGGGSDEILGGEGDDQLFGGAGSDSLEDPSYGAKGSDSGNDIGSGGAGEDEINLGSGDDEAFGGGGEDRIAVGAGNDRTVGGSGRDLIGLGPGDDRGAGGGGGDLLLGEQGEDVIHGGKGDDRLSGDAGRDSLFGDAGRDRIAAGMIVTRALGSREFLGSPGPLEGRPDHIECGAGRDGLKIGAGDSAATCESTSRAQPLEFQKLVQSDGNSTPRLHIMVRRPGTVELKGKGVLPQRLVSRDPHRAWGVPLRLVGRAPRVLIREGHVKLRLRLIFHVADGRKVTRFRTVDLLSVGANSRRSVSA